MAPTTPTLQQFPRLDPTISARSPSRSPRRKAEFAFRELDPLLGNLSPDSTLKALQATATISTGAAQEDALTSSIADATPAEREIGIRAAFAAQKLREWKDELSKWEWPGKQERGSGMGFIPPSPAQERNQQYRGCLPASVAEEYEIRLEEIRDDLDSLGIDEIKDHVLEAHLPTMNSSQLARSTGGRTSYGRMRDFTALITATVIQALPDLAKVNSLLDTWEIRFRVLRELPKFLDITYRSQSGIQQAFKQIREPASAQDLTEELLDSQKLALGGQVSDMGRRIDRLLDMLEGQQDSLPQAWIDRLEKIELDYATWVVEAQHVVLRNQLPSNPKKAPEPEERAATLEPTEQQHQEITAPGADVPPTHVDYPTAKDTPLQETAAELPSSGSEGRKTKGKPSLKLDLSQPKSHKREASKVSVADSVYSTFSDISNAEILDAKSTSVLPSPKISVVDNPLPTPRDEVTWFGSSSAAEQQMSLRPPMLQRASTASIEVVPQDKLRRVVLRKSASWDMLSQATSSPVGTPTKASKLLSGMNHSKVAAPSELEASAPGLPLLTRSADATPTATPSPEDELLRTMSQQGPQPTLPRRSSKRNTVLGLSSMLSTTNPDTNNAKIAESQSPTIADAKQYVRKHKRTESLDDKIKDLLTTLPGKIRMAKDIDSGSSSTSTTRTSTPTPALTLSPARTDASSRKGSLADPDIKLYHLTRSGHGREAPPVKLFVRTIGDGDRVMVRVGGGWADLGEYLKEYSLHHGSRATADGRLEVASFPGNGHRDSTTATNGASVPQVRRKSKSPTLNQTGFESIDLVNPKTRPPLQRPPSPERRRSREVGTWVPPPVPPIPSTFTAKAPAVMPDNRGDNGDITNQISAEASTAAAAAQMRYSVVNGPGGITTTTVVTPPVVSTNYTPLGGAGPKMNSRRPVTFGSGPNNDAWVQGMVGKARAVSGGGPTVTQGSNGTITTTTTTTTTVSSPAPPTSRRASSYFGPNPNHGSPVTISTSPSTRSVASDTKSSRRSSYNPASRKSSRMSLGDIGGIKRVFLRKKSETSLKEK